MIKAIETVYNGYRFRSRLEARWAVFFDAMEIKYQYEPEGWQLADGTRYLPDFLLERMGMWIEVKSGSPSQKELQKLISLKRETKQPTAMICGTPNFPTFKAARLYQIDENRRSFLKTMGGSRGNESVDWIMADGYYMLFVGRDGSDMRLFVDAFAVDKDGVAFVAPVMMPEPGKTVLTCKQFFCPTFPGGFISASNYTGPYPFFRDARLLAAYTAARQARFEHGETPLTNRRQGR